MPKCVSCKRPSIWFSTARAASMLSAASIFGRNSSWTACQSRPPGLVCQCLSRIAVHTYSKDWTLSCRCWGVSAAPKGLPSRKTARIAMPRATIRKSFFLENLGAQRTANDRQRGQHDEQHPQGNQHQHLQHGGIVKRLGNTLGARIVGRQLAEKIFGHAAVV